MASKQLTTALQEYGVPQTGDEIFVQVPATGINPVGGAAAAVAGDYGISAALLYANGSERVAAFNVAIPTEADRDAAPSARIGWTCDENTGDVRWGITYNYLGADDDATGTGTEVLGTGTVSTTADGYNFTSVDLGVIPADARIIQIRMTRYGDDALDTTTGDVYVLGSLIAFTIGDLT